MYQHLWEYKVEEKLYLGVREQKRLNTTGLNNIQMFELLSSDRTFFKIFKTVNNQHSLESVNDPTVGMGDTHRQHSVLISFLFYHNTLETGGI
jgi:hypothetical protein